MCNIQNDLDLLRFIFSYVGINQDTLNNIQLHIKPQLIIEEPTFFSFSRTLDHDFM